MNASSISNLTDGYTSYDELTANIHDLLSVLSFCICVSGFVGNFIIATVIRKRKKIQSPTNWLVFNLSICNLLMVLFVIPYNTTLPFTEWPFGVTSCKYAVRPVLELFTSVCVLTYSAINIARYSAICNVENRGGIKTKKAVVMIVLIWFISFLIASASLMGLLGQYNIAYVNGRSYCRLEWNSDSSRHSYRMTVFLLSYFLPMLVSGYTCGKIYYIVLKGLRKVTFIIPVDMVVLRRKKLRQVGSRLLVIFLVMFLTASPLQIFLLLQDFQLLPTFKRQNIVHHLLLVLFYLQSTTTPFLLLCMGDEYRKEVSRIFTGLCKTFPRLKEFSNLCKNFSKKLFEKHTIFTESRCQSYSVEQWMIAGKFVSKLLSKTHGVKARPKTKNAEVSLVGYHEKPRVGRKPRTYTECTELSLYDDYLNDSFSERIQFESQLKEICNYTWNQTQVFLEDGNLNTYNEDSNYELFRSTNVCRKRAASFSNNDSNNDTGKRDSLTTAFINFNKTYSLTIPSDYNLSKYCNLPAADSMHENQSKQIDNSVTKTDSNDMTSLKSQNILEIKDYSENKLTALTALPNKKNLPFSVANEKPTNNRSCVMYDEDDKRFQYLMEELRIVDRETYI